MSSSFTREEVAALVEESRGEGLIEEEEYDRLAGALGFTEKTVATVLMAPRNLTTVLRGSTPADVEALCAATGFSRFPVTAEDGELLGYLHIKDVLETDEQRRVAPIEDKWIRPFATVGTDEPLHEALEILQRRGSHLARVVDGGRRHARPGDHGGRHRGAGGGDPRRGAPRGNQLLATPCETEARRPTKVSDRGRRRTRTNGVWTLPNVLSALRLAGVPLFLWLVLGPEEDGWALVLLMVAGITDFLDGWLARKLNQQSVVGQILDPVADRLYILAVVVGLALRDIIPWWVAISLPAARPPDVGAGARCCAPVGTARCRCTSWARPRRSTCFTRSRCSCSATARACGDPGAGVRLGVRALGDRALLVGRCPLRLAGPQAAGDDRTRGRAVPDA